MSAVRPLESKRSTNSNQSFSPVETKEVSYVDETLASECTEILYNSIVNAGFGSSIKETYYVLVRDAVHALLQGGWKPESEEYEDINQEKFIHYMRKTKWTNEFTDTDLNDLFFLITNGRENISVVIFAMGLCWLGDPNYKDDHTIPARIAVRFYAALSRHSMIALLMYSRDQMGKSLDPDRPLFRLTDGQRDPRDRSSFMQLHRNIVMSYDNEHHVLFGWQGDSNLQKKIIFLSENQRFRFRRRGSNPEPMFDKYKIKNFLKAYNDDKRDEIKKEMEKEQSLKEKPVSLTYAEYRKTVSEREIKCGFFSMARQTSEELPPANRTLESKIATRSNQAISPLETKELTSVVEEKSQDFQNIKTQLSPEPFIEVYQNRILCPQRVRYWGFYESPNIYDEPAIQESTFDSVSQQLRWWPGTLKGP